MFNPNLLVYIPFAIFGFLFLIVLIIFLRGLNLYLSQQDYFVVQKGKRVLLNALWGFLVVVLIGAVFYLIIFFLGKQETTNVSAAIGDFPPSLSVNSPPPPDFIAIGRYYFRGPDPLNKVPAKLSGFAIYTILCKKSEGYDIIYIKRAEQYEKILSSDQYKCWIEKCGNNVKNLYVAFLWTPADKFNYDKRLAITSELTEAVNPFCRSPE